MFTWVRFIRHKNESLENLVSFCKRVKSKKKIFSELIGSRVITKVNLRISNSKTFTKKINMHMNFFVLEHFNKTLM